MEFKIVGLMLVRNEDWCLDLTLRAALLWVDHLCLTLHASDPSTQDLVERVRAEKRGCVSVFIDPDPVWNEMDQRQGLLEQARRCGGTHIAIIDADELLTGNLLPEIRDLTAQTPEGQILSLPGIQLWNGIDRYRNDGLFCQLFSLAFKDHLSYAWRPRKNGYQHHKRPPHPLEQGFCPKVEGGIFHLQFCRPRALRAKQAYYKVVELLRWPEIGVGRIDQKYNWWNTPPTALECVPSVWLEPYCQWLPTLDLSDDGECWRTKEICRMMREHGREKFAGLNLFGVA